MSYTVVIADAAKQDLIDVIDYLHEISESYSTIFISEFEEYLTHLEEAPELFIRVRGKYRRMYLKRFKYHIIFRIDGDVVTILAVVHEHRHPDRWMRE